MKVPIHQILCEFRSPLIAIFGLAAATGLAAPALAQKSYAEPTPQVEESNALADWWNGKYLTGNWFGLRDTLADNGLQLNGKYSAGFFGVVDSERGSRGFYDQELVFSGALNVGKLSRIEILEGLELEAVGRWRDPASNANPNNFVLASGMFNPSPWQSGLGWRFQHFGFEWNSKSLFPVKDMIQLRGGWVRPSTEFIDQPLSKLFMNNAITSAKGIGGNIPFSTSFSTWGGSLRVKPAEWAYTKLGLYMAYPRSTDSNNHGLSFQGYRMNPAENGLFTMIESGITPKLGAAELPGKYAVGGYYYGQRKNSFFGTPQFGQYGFYWQADQMLFRESSAQIEEIAPSGKDSSSAKSFKAPVSSEKPKLSNQGLSMFNLLTYAPKYNNLYPFYFQSGLAYTGLLPGRDTDQLYLGAAYGSYSYYNTVARRNAGSSNQPNYTLVIEGGYKINLSKFCAVSPFFEYLIRPNGTDNVGNGFLLGTNFSISF